MLVHQRVCLVFNDVTFKSDSIQGWFFWLWPCQVSASVSLCLAPLSKPGHPAILPLLSAKFGDESGLPTESAKVVWAELKKKNTKFSLTEFLVTGEMYGNVAHPARHPIYVYIYIYCMVLQVQKIEHQDDHGWPKAPFFTGGWRGAGSQRGLVSWGALHFTMGMAIENHRKPSAPLALVYPVYPCIQMVCDGVWSWNLTVSKSLMGSFFWSIN